eukprot:2989175-Pyramimonas_sp.AAC.1
MAAEMTCAPTYLKSPARKVTMKRKLSSHYLRGNRLDLLHMLTTILGMNIVQRICRISSSVGRWPYVKTIVDDSSYENNQWAPGWIRYRHGLH